MSKFHTIPTTLLVFILLLARPLDEGTKTSLISSQDCLSDPSLGLEQLSTDPGETHRVSAVSLPELTTRTAEPAAH